MWDFYFRFIRGFRCFFSKNSQIVTSICETLFSTKRDWIFISDLNWSSERISKIRLEFDVSSIVSLKLRNWDEEILKKESEKSQI